MTLKYLGIFYNIEFKLRMKIISRRKYRKERRPDLVLKILKTITEHKKKNSFSICTSPIINFIYV